MAKKLIINADDFGLDMECDDAIIHLAKVKSLTSTTILSNICSEKSFNQIKNLPISTGIHINLIEGKPVSKTSDVNTLISADGNFKSAFCLFKDFILGKINPNEIEIEITAQLKKISDYGISISHADSHQHIHVYPFLGNCIVQILQKLNVKKLRSCKLSEYASVRMFIVNSFHYISAIKNEFTQPDLLIPTFSLPNKISLEEFQKSIENSFKNYYVCEFMTHPATANSENSYLKKREEYDFWQSFEWKEYLMERKINLVNYNQI